MQICDGDNMGNISQLAREKAICKGKKAGISKLEMSDGMEYGKKKLNRAW